jgi:DNA-binding NtrC family response regulator
LLIETAPAQAGDSLGLVLGTDVSFERTSWDLLFPEQLRRCTAHLIVAVMAVERAKPLGFFHWLREHPINTPTFAIVPRSSDDELLRTVLEVADDFSLWPTRCEELRHRIDRLLPVECGTVEAVRTRLTEEMGLVQLIGKDPSFVRLVEQLPSIARNDAPVLIAGETGTGKELCARAIHFLGKRRTFPLIAVDCAAVPDHLFENELFGHARGAFTDAHRDQRGLVGMAEGGTLFLDEVDSLSLAAQAKLLRFLEEYRYRPLGSDRFIAANVNVVAATNSDLELCIQAKRFRSDLYFRLNVLSMRLPPLRERRGDIAVLACHFAQELQQGSSAKRKTFSASALRRLALYHWPGNVRELRNVVHRALVGSEGTTVMPCDVPVPDGLVQPPPSRTNFRQARAAFERVYVEELLRKHQGNVTRAAKEAQKERRAFGRLIKKHSISR